MNQQEVKQYIGARRHYLKAFAVYLIIALVMFWQITIGIFTNVVNGHGDVYQTMFNLWWVPYSLFALHQSPYFTSLLYYPIGANLVTQTLTPLAGLISAPLQWISPALAYNALFFLSFPLSGIFMFALANYFVRNRYAAFLAGLIFAFSPMHIAQAYGHLDWTIIEWIPLFLFFYIKTLHDKKPVYAVLAGLCFMLTTFMGDIEQGIMLLFATIVLTILYLILDRKAVLNKQSLVNIGYTIGASIVFCIPFFLLMLPYLSSSAFSTAQAQSDLISNMLWSNNFFSFFLPSYYNGIFHSAALSYSSSIYGLTYQGASYYQDVGEKVSYLGYSVIALMLIAIYYDWKKERMKRVLLWLVAAVFFAWLSMGPYIQFGSTVSGLPGIYALYSALPIFNIIREPGRFDLMATIAVAIIAAIGFTYLTSEKPKATAFKYLAVFSILILIEYNGMPLSGSTAAAWATSAQIPKAYAQIGALPGNFSVLVLPALPNQSDTPAQYIGMATYYVSAFHKPLIGGYTSRENSSQQLAVSSIPIVVATSYLENGEGLLYPSPIKENFTQLDLLWLATYNTSYITVIRSAFNLSEQEQLYSYLANVFGNPVYNDNTTFVFDTRPAILTYAGRTTVAYTLGTWISGYEFCTATNCNTTFANMWWGESPRYLVVYAPQDENVQMSLEGMSYVQSADVGIYIDNNLINTLITYHNLNTYNLNMTLPQGYSEIAFYSNTTVPQSQYLAFGLDNISFTPK